MILFFAQLHHPYKSELWTPGESDFTGEVITRLEQFTANCQKPSIHFFGHTHGYSRGQSRDHKHLWINVATAGGAIDNWGEFPNFDYDEFSISQDEYGFVLVEVTADDDPKLVIKHISQGDQDSIFNNRLTDSLTIRLNHSVVNTPDAISPVETEVAPECVVLQASAFSAPIPGALHGQSHWQVATSPDGFDQPVAERWKNFENWYYDVDTQAGDDLTDEPIPGLAETTTYYWRVRYRDREMNWSDWSAPAEFSTGKSLALPNLINNSGAENDLQNWTIAEGVVEALESEVCDGIPPHRGLKYFAVGGLCEHSEVGRAVQRIDVSAYTDSIQAGAFTVRFGGYLSNYAGSDLPEMKIIFIDSIGTILGESNTISTLNNNWMLLTESAILPHQTRFIDVELKGTRNTGTDNDSYFDDLFLTLGTETVDCEMMTSVSNSAAQMVGTLQIFPNPARQIIQIRVPEFSGQTLILQMTDAQGMKINISPQYENQTIWVNVNHLPAGVYYVWLRNSTGLLGAGKLVIAAD